MARVVGIWNALKVREERFAKRAPGDGMQDLPGGMAFVVRQMRHVFAALDGPSSIFLRISQQSRKHHSYTLFATEQVAGNLIAATNPVRGWQIGNPLPIPLL